MKNCGVKLGLKVDLIRSKTKNSDDYDEKYIWKLNIIWMTNYL